MKEGILVIIREMGLFARLSRREKKNRKKSPGSEPRRIQCMRNRV